MSYRQLLENEEVLSGYGPGAREEMTLPDTSLFMEKDKAAALPLLVFVSILFFFKFIIMFSFKT